MNFGELLMANSSFGDEIDPKGKKKPPTIGDEMKVLARRNLKYDNKNSLDLARSASKYSGVNPALLLSSAYQEGMNQAVSKQGVSEAYAAAKVPSDYPVDAFFHYGIDSFSDYLPSIKQYLPKDFTEDRYKVFPASNEVDEKTWAKQNIPLLQQQGLLPKNFEFDFYKNMEDVYNASDKYKGKVPLSKMAQSAHPAAFKTNEDALIVKAAILKSTMNEIDQYAKKKGLVLDDESRNYFTLARYNASPKTSYAMIDEFAAAKDKKAFLKQGVYKNKYAGGVHKNISPRIESMGVAQSLLDEPQIPITQ